MLRLVKEWGIGHRVKYISSIPNKDVRHITKYARGLILASVPTTVWQEQFGYVLAEAMTSGCPIVSTVTGSIPEVVGEAGILVPPANPPKLAAAIGSLVDDQIYAKYSTLAQQACKRFSAERFRNEIFSIYKDLL
jgi:glycosyltransferase involved in cell wall biosynthesis